MRSNILADLLSTIFSRKFSGSQQLDGRPIEQLCDSLLTSSGEVSGVAIAQSVLTNYASLERDDKLRFFGYLTEKLDLDATELAESAVQYSKSPSTENLSALHHAAEPPRQELFRRLNQAPQATAALVNMRHELLGLIRENPSFGRTDLDFSHLLSSWFNRGFLVLRRINWETPANLLEKIIEYEAVHAINDWNDLRRRLQPDDRRCFAFFHPSMPDEPLIFVEVALSKGIPNSIQDVLAEERTSIDLESADTAVFYSISNCQGGLRGISLGNSLIKQVVEDLSWELPKLTTFVTLSPIPGLNSWLESIRNDEPLAKEVLETVEQVQGNESSSNFEDYTEVIRLLACRYLVEVKRPDEMPSDPVARFHLGNGAMLHDVHAFADMSKNGLNQSCGTMVNYLYELGKVEQNHEDFVTSGTIAQSKDIQGILRSGMQNKKIRRLKNG